MHAYIHTGRTEQKEQNKNNNTITNPCMEEQSRHKSIEIPQQLNIIYFNHPLKHKFRRHHHLHRIIDTYVFHIFHCNYRLLTDGTGSEIDRNDNIRGKLIASLRKFIDRHVEKTVYTANRMPPLDVKSVINSRITS